MQKIIMIATFAVLLISLTVSAQSRQTPQDRVKALKERLSLTDDQAAQVEKIFTQAQDKMKSSSDRSEFRKIMSDANDQVQQLLTETQKTEFKKMQDERTSKMRNHQNNSTDKNADTKTEAKPDSSRQK
jgi:Spy/CpxP family protein refolding chaperone